MKGVVKLIAIMIIIIKYLKHLICFWLYWKFVLSFTTVEISGIDLISLLEV